MPLFVTQFLGAFNDNFLKNALVILITYRGVAVFGIPPGQMVAAAGGIFILPFFLFSATAGQLADRLDKALLTRWIKIAEIAIMGIAVLGFASGQYSLLLVALFLMGTHSTFFGPIKFAILPQHLKGNELVAGNAWIEAGTFLAILLGTIAGGTIVSMESGGIEWTCAGLVLFALAGWLTSLAIPPAPAGDPNLKVEWNPIPPTRRLIVLVRKDPLIYRSILGISWFWLVGAAYLSVFPTYGKDLLQVRESVVTFFLALFSIGIGIGSLFCGWLSRGKISRKMVMSGALGMSLFSVALGAIGTPPIEGAQEALTVAQLLKRPDGIGIVISLLGLAFSSGLYVVPLYSLMQERAKPAERSRVIAVNNILNSLLMVGVAGILIAFFQMGFEIPTLFVGLGLVNAAITPFFLPRPESSPISGALSNH